MSALKLFSLLLDYPRDELWLNHEELLEAADGVQLPKARRTQLKMFVTELLEQPPMAAQEAWLGLFDRGRSMSLLMFEHIHGESRDRGQAMVDLMQTYLDNGFELSAKELPDYLPLMLEYLSLRPNAEVVDWLSHTGHILELLAARASERGSSYAYLLEILAEYGQSPRDLSLVRKRAAAEQRDDTPEMMDKVWEEETVRFGNEAPTKNCEPPNRLPAGARTVDKAAHAHPAPAALVHSSTSQVTT
jgi:nitrate reductase molybdenum cofactor assembly chaperone NarJ/NarW